MTINELAAAVAARRVRGDGDAAVRGISYDSRRVQPGDAFFAVRGLRVDGHDFVGDAVAAGARAVVVTREVAVPAGVATVMVDDTRVALARAAAAFYRHPGREVRVLGVTGTNGKTTTCYLLDIIFRAAGKKTALFTTVANVVAGEKVPARLTTEEAPEVQRRLRKAAAAGAAVAVLEVSSHALALARVAEVPFAGAIFTNLTHDHLDFHGDMEGYFGAKARLFAARAPQAPAVVNGDDPYGQRLAGDIAPPAFTFGRGPGNYFRAVGVTSSPAGVKFRVVGADGWEMELASPLVGEFNAANILAAASLAHLLGVADDAVAAGVAALRHVPGRLEVMDLDRDLRVVIDYAHAPASMEVALAAIRSWDPRARLVVVFGCTGDRDRAKRPAMAEVARRFADFVVVTTDDPYYEDPAAIAAMAEAALVAAGAARGRDYDVILDRGEAIYRALVWARAKAGPAVVAVLGKGHETVQKVRGEEIPFDDREAVRAAAAALALAP